MIPGSLRTRLALLYACVFLIMAVVALAIPFLAVSETVHVGSSAPPVVSHPGWIDKGEAAIIYQAALKRHRLLPNVPALPELAASDEGRAIMKRYGFLLPGETATSARAN